MIKTTNNLNFFSILFFIFCITININSQEVKEEKSEDEKKLRKVIIPTVSYNNSFKTSVGVMAGLFYNLNSTDTISPESSTMFIGRYSANKTWMTILPSKFYFKEDKYRSLLVAGLGSINFQTFVDYSTIFDNIGIPIPPIFQGEEGGQFIDYNTNVQFLYADFLINVYDRLYAGINIIYAHNKTVFDVEGNPSETQNLFGFGLSTEYDKRDNQMQPIKGFNAKLTTNTFLESLGSTANYSNINFQYNHFFQQGKRNTLLIRAFGQISVGDVPFSGQNVVGRDDLRGYSNGKYRADQVYDIQTEYRHWFAEKWGYVAFGGVATAIDGPSDLSFDNLLPAVGAGIRFMAIPKSRITVGMDVAAGKDDWGLYFRIGEAFGR
ncbi:BamA/TamA family outer membrane protein [Flavicella sp.]|uniref:BamA/TamA family outer membrane protein n=1 Tax=Flavicella sp. TaxID=2957742 RepID=UPI00261DDC0B|nr:BamA/TamA family outer membrane protein [Flavicella sp.]MDG1805661.1 BamA/TamA family outer membrane protein [Flavicella sp.]